MNTELENIPMEDMRIIRVDNETLRILEELCGMRDSFYDWWELSQGIKYIAIGLKCMNQCLVEFPLWCKNRAGGD